MFESIAPKENVASVKNKTFIFNYLQAKDLIVSKKDVPFI